MTNSEDYNVNFFKPLSDHAKTNKKLIATLAIIWFCAVFGFQALLMILNEPTPEKAFTTFESVWPEVVNNRKHLLKQNSNFPDHYYQFLGKILQ